MDHTGPEGKGPKTGRKLGECRKSEADQFEVGKIGVGQAKRRHSGGGKGQGKRKKYKEEK